MIPKAMQYECDLEVLILLVFAPEWQDYVVGPKLPSRLTTGNRLSSSEPSLKITTKPRFRLTSLSSPIRLDSHLRVRTPFFRLSESISTRSRKRVSARGQVADVQCAA